MSARLRSPLAIVAATLAAGVVAGCNSIDLSKALQVQPVLTGYYDGGVINGTSHLVPSITFKLRNVASQSVSAGLPITVSFWFVTDLDGENDSVQVHGLDQALQPGAETEAFTVRAPHGFNLEGARADFFHHSLFKDMIAKIFVQRGGKFYRLGEFPIERQIIPHVYSTPGRP